MLFRSQQLQQLQSEAEGLKAQLAALPEISAEQVRELRQAEQQRHQAQARAEAMAASLEVVRSDQALLLNGTPLQVGERCQLSDSADLQVGDGVLLRLSPGGGQALPQARAELERCNRQLQHWQQTLQLSTSDQAEQIERQRRSLEGELANLRKAARAIPWSGLQERLTALAPRRQQLQQALAEQEPLLSSLADGSSTDPRQLQRDGLEQWQEQLRSSGQQLEQASARQRSEEQQQQQAERRSQAALDANRQQLAQLEGRRLALQQRLETLEQQLAPEAQRQQQHHQLEQQLAAGEAQLGAMEQELQQLGGSHPQSAEALQAALQRLEQSREQLLNQRGQSEQLCTSLGATNPMAELEQRQAAWEDADQQKQRVLQQAQALSLLLERFHRAQSELADRYSEPLRQAAQPYLQELLGAPLQPLLDFDPQQGFDKLQLQHGQQTYAFERLSGGMREQMATAMRLAMAEVLKPAYNDVLPLIFDDAFSNTDQERLAGLQRMLRRGMEQGLQVVLLTCQPERYGDTLLQAEKNPPTDGEGMAVISTQLR